MGDSSRVVLTVNGDRRIFDASLTVAELLVEMDLAGKRLAVELNRQILPKSRHAQRRLADGDRVEIIQAIGGG